MQMNIYMKIVVHEFNGHWSLVDNEWCNPIKMPKMRTILHGTIQIPKLHNMIILFFYSSKFKCHVTNVRCPKHVALHANPIHSTRLPLLPLAVTTPPIPIAFFQILWHNKSRSKMESPRNGIVRICQSMWQLHGVREQIIDYYGALHVIMLEEHPLNLNVIACINTHPHIPLI